MSQYQFLKKTNQIRNMARRTKPDAAWVLATRSTLLMQAKNSLPTSVVQRSSVFKEWFKFFSPLFSFGKWMRKPAFSIAAIILAIFGGSLLSVSAAERSLPGDLLYSVKLATEQARLALAKNPQERVTLKTEFTGRRVDEMKQVVAGSASDRGDKVIQTAEVLKRDMHTIKQQLDDMQGQSSPETVKETAKMVDEKSNAVVQALQESKDTMTSEEKVKVTEAQAAASDTSVKAIEVLVETNKTSADVVTDQDVADIMKTHNESVVKTMAQSVGLNPDTATSTGSLSLPISNKTMTSSTVAVLAKVTEAQKSFDEADKLVSEDKIDEAMEKVKLGTQQAFAAQKTVEQDDVKADQAAVDQQAQASGSATSTAATGTTKTTTSTCIDAKSCVSATINSNPTTTKPAP